MHRPERPLEFVHSTIHSLLFKRLPGVLLGLAIGFGLTLVVNAQEPNACLFGLLQCDEQGVVWDFSVIGADNVAQLSSSDGLAEAIIAFGYFLNRTILPLLMAIALLVFLFYLARTFILDVALTEKREESRKRALWGFAAFILIVSLWGIVNLLVSGFRIDTERSLCPDYLGNFCGNLDNRGSGGGYSGESNLDFGNDSGSFGGNSGGFNGGSGGSNADGTLPQPSTQSALGELLFGQYADNASFNFREGPPRAADSALALPESMSCQAGLNALQTSASIEALQSGYLLYRDTSGQLRWHNITDSTGEAAIALDVDELRPLVSTTAGTNVALVHTHPQATIDRLDLDMFGYGPSVSDMELLCDDVLNSAAYVVVDSANVWTVESTGATCPRRASAVDALPIISTLLQLAIMESTQRNDTFTEMYEWDELPPSVWQGLRDYETTDFDTWSTTDLLLLADSLARDGGMRISRQTPNDFCTQF